MTKEAAKREIEELDFYLQNHTDDYGESSHTAMMMAAKALEKDNEMKVYKLEENYYNEEYEADLGLFSTYEKALAAYKAKIADEKYDFEQSYLTIWECPVDSDDFYKKVCSNYDEDHDSSIYYC